MYVYVCVSLCAYVYVCVCACVCVCVCVVCGRVLVRVYDVYVRVQMRVYVLRDQHRGARNAKR